ncbi:hypothetical protein BGW80DRAFT_1465457 [Lactifluus volemus]|nr:hypothetical protein BGW80DRAFT_1465457 [Lactifluus volemus]
MEYSQIQQANEPLEHDIAPNPRPIPRTVTLHDRVQENLRVQPAAGNNQFAGPLANIPPPLVVGENVAMQGYPQDPHYIDVVHDDSDMPVQVGYYHRPQPGYPEVPYVYHDAGVAQGIPVQPQAIQVQVGPEIQGHNHFQFDYGPQLLVPGPARAELPDPWAHNAPVRDYPPAENLGSLARRYLDHPNSEVTQVVITLEMPGVL